ncbi:MAG TPA: alkaline phosphatase family protein [Nitrososphaeraceae archaeon]|nr:alkaline phosphatase family protein [Nitrososphaeraceae archaeon]
MLFKSLYFILLVFFSFSISSIVFVITTAYSYDNIGLSQKNKTPIDHVIVISQGRRSFDNYFGSYEESNGFPKNVSIPINPFEFSPSFQNFTISLSFNSNISNAGKESFLINKGGIGKETPGNNLNFGIWLNEKEHLTGGFETKNGKDFFVVSENKYTDNNWHHVLLTYNQSVLKLFVDKNLQAKKNTQGEIPDDNNLPFIRLGANFLKQNNFYVGSIDNVLLWNRSLSENEISSFFTTKDIPPGSIVDIGLSTTNIKYENKNSPLNFNGTNYFDLKVIPNITEGLIEPFHLKNTKTPNLKYGPLVYEKSYNYGFMDGFIHAQNDNTIKLNDISKKDNHTIVMGYYNNSEIGPYWYLASNFVLADNFFSATRQTDLTNNLHLFTTEEGNFKKYVPTKGLSINSTVLDLLEKKRFTWKIYVENYDSGLNYTNANESSKRYLTLNPILGIPRFVENATLNGRIQDLSNYFHDLKHNLPSVSYIILPDSQESSPKDILKGQESVVSLIISLMQSKHWKNSLFILTYSGSGGWYDHVPTPLNSGSEHGFRVPTLFISPYSHKGIIDSTFYDTLSIVKFIEYNFNLKSIDMRDSLSNNILGAFDFDKPPRNSNESVAKLVENYQTTITKKKPIIKENIFFTFNIYLIVLVCIILFPLILRFILKK